MNTIIQTKSKNQNSVKKVFSVILGIAFAVVMSAPYIIYKEQIQHMKTLGYLGVLLACAISNVSILIPSSSTLIVVTAASALNPFLCILMGGIGTAIGEQTSYLCGRIGQKGFDQEKNKGQRVQEWLAKHDVGTVFLFAFLPLPIFDIVGVAAGAVGMKWTKYLVAAVLGKILKFTLAVVGIYYILPACLPYMVGPGRIMIEEFLQQVGMRS